MMCGQPSSSKISIDFPALLAYVVNLRSRAGADTSTLGQTVTLALDALGPRADHACGERGKIGGSAWETISTGTSIGPDQRVPSVPLVLPEPGAAWRLREIIC